MKFGMFIIGDSHPEAARDLGDYYDAMIEQVTRAERLGYQGFWFGEHHFDFAGVIPAPPVFMAAAARATTTIRLGVAVSLLPYRDPIFVAEEYAMVDVLSRGRLDFGVGRGTPPELKGFGVTEDNRELLLESLEVVKRAWSEGRVSFHGRYRTIDDVSLNVRPVQRPTPPLFLAALSDESYRMAGINRYPVLGIPYASCKDMAELERKISLYRESLAASGEDPAAFEVIQCFHAHAAESEREADANARQGMVPYLAARIQVRPRGYDELLGKRLVVVGSPRRCIEQIEEIRSTGTDHIIFMMNFATLPQEKVLASMEIMAREVLPKLAIR
ncbi:MAG TPA: LLM class flavin-dependent oxidoreductase [candidate division Zixibacteria bacterium]|nr:LLM class flavin-dependent oxidoreductase [candidate division Zixibacteria bacterium]